MPGDPVRNAKIAAARAALVKRRDLPTEARQYDEQGGFKFKSGLKRGKWTWLELGGCGNLTNLGTAGKRSAEELDARRKQIQKSDDKRGAKSIAQGGSKSTLMHSQQNGSKGGTGRKRGMSKAEKQAHASEALQAIAGSDELDDDSRGAMIVQHLADLRELARLKDLLDNAETPAEKTAANNLIFCLIPAVVKQLKTLVVDMEDGGGARTQPRRGTWAFGAGTGRLGVAGELLTKIVDEENVAGFLDGELQACWDEVGEVDEESDVAATLAQFGREAADAARHCSGLVVTDAGRCLWAAFGRNQRGLVRGGQNLSGLSAGMDVLAWLFGITFQHRAFQDCQDQHRVWGALLRALVAHYVKTGQVHARTGALRR